MLKKYSAAKSFIYQECFSNSPSSVYYDKTGIIRFVGVLQTILFGFSSNNHG